LIFPISKHLSVKVDFFSLEDQALRHPGKKNHIIFSVKNVIGNEIQTYKINPLWPQTMLKKVADNVINEK